MYTAFTIIGGELSNICPAAPGLESSDTDITIKLITLCQSAGADCR